METSNTIVRPTAICRCQIILKLMIVAAGIALVFISRTTKRDTSKISPSEAVSKYKL
jgi:hypothetical protein